MNTEYDPKEYSKWAQAVKLYEAKYAYYHLGKNSLTDQEYDNLEQQFKDMFGEPVYKKLITVGYDKDRHMEAKQQRDQMRIIFRSIHNYG